MDSLTTVFHLLLLILVVLAIFNVIIFVHELGHFLAAKWRGLQVDRFQIWFGKPLWKTKIRGVEYGLGWIPAGGFVSLPQMAPMDAIEGTPEPCPERPLEPISASDKIIVAFAGPLFSMLLALATAVCVWKAGKPMDFIRTTEIGYVEEGSPGQKAGLRAGDKIIAINGQPVRGFQGTLDSVMERIVLSRGAEIVFQVTREGAENPLTLTSTFEIEKSAWYERRGLRDVGISPAGPVLVAKVYEKSPAAEAGIKVGDQLIAVDGQRLYSTAQLSDYYKALDWGAAKLEVKAPDGESRIVQVQPEKPLQPKDAKPMIGVLWDFKHQVDVSIVHPNPFQQVIDSLRMMWVTITAVTASDSNIGIDHLSGPVGIGTLMYDLLLTEDGWLRILAFVVLFNVNLAVLNMLPFPVLDGGHITLAILEKISGRPVKARMLEVVQTACALALIFLMLFVTSKDIAGRLGGGGSEREELIFQ